MEAINQKRSLSRKAQWQFNTFVESWPILGQFSFPLVFLIRRIYEVDVGVLLLKPGFDVISTVEKKNFQRSLRSLNHFCQRS